MEMKPLNCCKSCDGLNENGIFRNKLKCLFCDKLFLEETKKLYDEQKRKKGVPLVNIASIYTI